MDPSHGQDQYQLDGEEGELVPSADSREHIEANENINFMEDLQNLLSIETFDKYVSPFNVPVDLTAGDVTSLDEQIQLEKLAWSSPLPDISSSHDTDETDLSGTSLPMPSNNLPFTLGQFAVCMLRRGWLTQEYWRDEGLELLGRLESATRHTFDGKKAYSYRLGPRKVINFNAPRRRSGGVAHCWHDAIFSRPHGSIITALVRSIDSIGINEETMMSLLSLCVSSGRTVYFLFQFTKVYDEIDVPGRVGLRGLAEVLHISAVDFYNHMMGISENSTADSILWAWRNLEHKNGIMDRNRMPNADQSTAFRVPLSNRVHWACP